MPEARLESAGAVATQPAIDRLDFTLHDFTRVAWVSDPARVIWAPRLARISTAWAEIEWRSVLAGVRSCAVTMASPEEFLTQGARWAEAGLGALPVEMVGVSGQPYSATSTPLEAGRPFQFRFVLGKPETLASFKTAWDDGDQATIGALLGYPTCCSEFFRRVWVDEAMVDTTWPMAAANGRTTEEGTVEVDGPAQANILWRWMGLRAVPHLPCRFDCPATVEFADRLLVVGREAGFDEEMDWLLEVLSWPAQWSALHGIGEVKTPVLKLVTRTDATSRPYVVRRRGNAYPAEGAQGLAFPLRPPRKRRLTESRGFRRGLQHAVRTPQPSWYATDNGFSSVVAMDEAHRPIVKLAASALAGHAGRVVDFGCGNGALLEKLRAATPDVIPFGIDTDPVRVEHARLLQPDFRSHFLVGDLLDADWALGAPWRDRFALGILMPGRLLEAGPERAQAIRERLRSSCDRVLVYAYKEWSATRSLSELTSQAGLMLVGEAHGDRVALATVPTNPTEEIRNPSGEIRNPTEEARDGA
ncbi:MAG: class I SAM-dependent methyltransferase [Solirubrobacteraceae bacterium]